MEPLGFERFCFQTEEGDWIECPTFEGKDPKLWVVSIEKFLNRFGIPTEQHVNFSSHQIWGDAHLWVELNRYAIARWNWPQFVQALCAEFDRSENIAEIVVEEHEQAKEEMVACTTDLDLSSAKSNESGCGSLLDESEIVNDEATSIIIKSSLSGSSIREDVDIDGITETESSLSEENIDNMLLLSKKIGVPLQYDVADNWVPELKNEARYFSPYPEFQYVNLIHIHGRNPQFPICDRLLKYGKLGQAQQVFDQMLDLTVCHFFPIMTWGVEYLCVLLVHGIMFDITKELIFNHYDIRRLQNGLVLPEKIVFNSQFDVRATLSHAWEQKESNDIFLLKIDKFCGHIEFKGGTCFGKGNFRIFKHILKWELFVEKSILGMQVRCSRVINSILLSGNFSLQQYTISRQIATALITSLMFVARASRLHLASTEFITSTSRQCIGFQVYEVMTGTYTPLLDRGFFEKCMGYIMVIPGFASDGFFFVLLGSLIRIGCIIPTVDAITYGMNKILTLHFQGAHFIRHGFHQWCKIVVASIYIRKLDRFPWLLVQVMVVLHIEVTLLSLSSYGLKAKGDVYFYLVRSCFSWCRHDIKVTSTCNNIQYSLLSNSNDEPAKEATNFTSQHKVIFLFMQLRLSGDLMLDPLTYKEFLWSSYTTKEGFYQITNMNLIVFLWNAEPTDHMLWEIRVSSEKHKCFATIIEHFLCSTLKNVPVTVLSYFSTLKSVTDIINNAEDLVSSLFIPLSFAVMEYTVVLVCATTVGVSHCFLSIDLHDHSDAETATVVPMSTSLRLLMKWFLVVVPRSYTAKQELAVPDFTVWHSKRVYWRYIICVVVAGTMILVFQANCTVYRSYSERIPGNTFQLHWVLDVALHATFTVIFWTTSAIEYVSSTKAGWFPCVAMFKGPSIGLAHPGIKVCIGQFFYSDVFTSPPCVSSFVSNHQADTGTSTKMTVYSSDPPLFLIQILDMSGSDNVNPSSSIATLSLLWCTAVSRNVTTLSMKLFSDDFLVLPSPKWYLDLLVVHFSFIWTLLYRFLCHLDMFYSVTDFKGGTDILGRGATIFKPLQWQLGDRAFIEHNGRALQTDMTISLTTISLSHMVSFNGDNNGAACLWVVNPTVQSTNVELASNPVQKYNTVELQWNSLPIVTMATSWAVVVFLWFIAWAITSFPRLMLSLRTRMSKRGGYCHDPTMT